MYLPNSFPWQTSRNRLAASRTEKMNVPTWTEFFTPNRKKKAGWQLFNQYD